MTLIAVVIVAALIAVALGSAVADRAHARATADLAALAAAHAERERRAGFEPEGTCAVGGAVASANSAAIIACEIAADGSVTVKIRAGAATASARAGGEMRWPGDASG